MNYSRQLFPAFLHLPPLRNSNKQRRAQTANDYVFLIALSINESPLFWEDRPFFFSWIVTTSLNSAESSSISINYNSNKYPPRSDSFPSISRAALTASSHSSLLICSELMGIVYSSSLKWESIPNFSLFNENWSQLVLPDPSNWCISSNDKQSTLTKNKHAYSNPRHSGNSIAVTHVNDYANYCYYSSHSDSIVPKYCDNDSDWMKDDLIASENSDCGPSDC